MTFVRENILIYSQSNLFPPVFYTQYTQTYPQKDCLFVRAGRIELPYPAWKAGVLPLNHARSFFSLCPRQDSNPQRMVRSHE